MLLLLYTLTAALMLWLLHRFVCRLSRAAAALLFFLPFLFVGHALVANRVYAPIDKPYMSEPLKSVAAEHGMGKFRNPVTADIFAQMIPWRHVVRESYSRGEWPLWNRSILCGDILAAAAQPAPYSPFTLVALLLPAPISFTLTAALTFLIAAAGAFAFARDLGCRESAAAVAAAGFALSAGIALYVLWPLGLNWALLPLVFLGVRRAVHAPSVHSWGLLTTAFALLLLAGHGESALHIIFLGAIYGLFELLSVRRHSWRAIATAVAAGIAALLVCAIYLLPHFDVLPESAEYQIRRGWVEFVRSDTTPQVLASLATNVFPSLHVRRWIDPAIPGVKAETAAVGSIVLALAIYAVWRARSKTTWFFFAMALLCIAAHAAWRPVMVALHALPLFDITLNERLAFGGAFALAILAALGVEEIARRDDRRAARGTLGIVFTILFAGTIAISHAFVVDSGPADWGRWKVFAELVFLAAAAILFALRIPTRTAILGTVALLLVQRTMSDGGVHASYPAKAAYPPLEIMEPLKQARTPFRVAGHDWSFIPATAALYGLEDARGYEAMTFAPLMETYQLWSVHQPVFFNRIDDLSKPFLSLLNVRFAFGSSSTAVPPGWRVAKKKGDAVLLENPNALERAFVPRIVNIGLQRSLIIAMMGQVTDFRERAWIIAPGVTPYERANGPGRVTIREAKHGYELDADMDGDGWIVVTNSDWKGWRAYIDGRRVQTQRANAAFIGIYTPKGRHSIRLVYWPDAFVRGRAVTFATLATIALFMVIRKVRA